MPWSAHDARWIREEAAMATIPLNAAHQDKRREQSKTVLAAFREMLRKILSDRMRRTAVQADHVCPRQVPETQPESVNAFELLDSSIISDAIPAFFIGRNRAGLWVAREAKGRTGGLFLLKSSALSFARAQSAPKGCATIFPSEKFELDLENEGNPFADRLASLMRLATIDATPMDGTCASSNRACQSRPTNRQQ
jgi:hypothetical protein